MATYDETAIGPVTPMTGGVAHDNQIVAMFETYQQARAARDKLVASGVPASETDILDRNASATDASFSYERNSEGFWGVLKNLFMPEEDSHSYAEGLDRGHAMLVVRPRPDQRDRVMTVLESCEPIDFDARENEWRRGGWAGTHAGAVAINKPMAIPPAMPAAAAPPRNVIAARTDDKIEVLEESLRVGKREVGAGHIRVRSYVVERPIEEQVTLREEHVTLERHPVDRPLGVLPADAFRERTIDVTATSEEAVIAKDVRVVEEIGLRKDATQRTETIKDTIRRTEVEIENDATDLAAKRPVTPR